MTKIRMNDEIRRKLKSAVAALVKPADLQKPIDAAYRKAAPLVRRAVEKKFPPADMAICAKYDVARPDSCITVQGPSGMVQTFDFEDDGPVVTKRTYSGQVYLVNRKTIDAVEAWEQAKSLYEKERKKRLDAYRSLIGTARYLEDVIEIWPEAAEICPPSQPLVPVTKETASIITADMSERGEGAR